MTEPESQIDLTSLATEQRNPASAQLDLLDTLEIVRVINDQDRLVAEAVARELPAIAAAVDILVEAIRAGGRLIYIGAGTSGRLGVLDASECPPTYNTDPAMVVGLIAGGDHALRHSIEHVEDQPREGAAALKEVNLNARDVVSESPPAVAHRLCAARSSMQKKSARRRSGCRIRPVRRSPKSRQSASPRLSDPKSSPDRRG